MFAAWTLSYAHLLRDVGTVGEWVVDE